MTHYIFRNAHAKADSIQIRYMVFCELNMPPSKVRVIYRYRETAEVENTDISTTLIREYEGTPVIGKIDMDGYFWVIFSRGEEA